MQGTTPRGTRTRRPGHCPHADATGRSRSSPGRGARSSGSGFRCHRGACGIRQVLACGRGRPSSPPRSCSSCHFCFRGGRILPNPFFPSVSLTRGRPETTGQLIPHLSGAGLSFKAFPFPRLAPNLTEQRAPSPPSEAGAETAPDAGAGGGLEGAASAGRPVPCGRREAGLHLSAKARRAGMGSPRP